MKTAIKKHPTLEQKTFQEIIDKKEKKKEKQHNYQIQYAFAFAHLTLGCPISAWALEGNRLIKPVKAAVKAITLEQKPFKEIIDKKEKKKEKTA